jgi:hypothetical protein
MEASADPNKLRAFIIGPIGDRDAEDGSHHRNIYEDAIEVLEYVIRPACAAVDIKPVRADEISKAGEINEQVFRLLRDAPVVIADLTGANPNVMYELGLRHTTGKLTFQIGEKERLPFDVSTIRTILFKRNEAGLISAKRLLIAALAEGLAQGADPVAATRIWLERPGVSIPLSDIENSTEEDDPPGFLELLAELELGLPDIAQTSERATSILDEITRVLEEGTEKINHLPAVQNYSSLKLAIVNQIAAELREPSERLNVVSGEFHRNVERIAPGIEYMLIEMSQDPGQREVAREFLDQIHALFEVSSQAAIGAESFARVLEQASGSTRLMRKVNDSIRRSTLSMVATFRKVAAWQGLAEKISP